EGSSSWAVGRSGSGAADGPQVYRTAGPGQARLAGRSPASARSGRGGLENGRRQARRRARPEPSREGEAGQGDDGGDAEGRRKALPARAAGPRPERDQRPADARPERPAEDVRELEAGGRRALLGKR